MNFGRRLLNRASRSRLSPVGFLEAGLWVAAFACGAVVLSHVVGARAAEHDARMIGAVRMPSKPVTLAAEAGNPSPPADTDVHAAGAVMARLEIPGIALTVPVLEDDDQADLERGVGHIPGTAGPGGLGNFALAGHRDTFLRPLRNIRRGMEVDVVTPEGKYQYQVDSTEIVTPRDVQVLDIRDRPELTLITCYPFWYIGHAPRRFIVHAHLLSLIPS